MNQEEFFLANQVDGQLSDEQMAQMLNLPIEGETTAKVEPSVPDAELKQVEVDELEDKKEKEAQPKVEEQEKTPVILAKDGIHTIPFEKLAEARAAQQLAAEEAARYKAELDALKSTNKPAAEAEKPPEAKPEDLFGDYSDEALKKGIEKLVDMKVSASRAELESKFAAAVEPIQAKQKQEAEDAHYSTILKAHPNAVEIAQSNEMAKWIESHPSYARSAMQHVLAAGSAGEIVELLNNFTSATAKPAAPTKPDAEAAALAVIAKAQAKPPSSLSEIPAGSAVRHDDAAAMLDMSPTGALNKFEGKTPAQIEAMISRLL